MINRLNVYPVPDGDTGTNMALTLRSVVEEVDGAEGADMAATCKAISHGSLMGARGNSGRDPLPDPAGPHRGGAASDEAADGACVSAALSRAAEAAYGAVMRPVEGTILTVVREAAEAAATAAEGGGRPRRRARRRPRPGPPTPSSARPSCCRCWPRPGVVDAGGTGFLLLLDVAPRRGRRPGRARAGGRSPVRRHRRPRRGRATATACGDLRYEVMYFLEAPDEAIPAFKDVWAGIGDSIVVVGGDGIWNCHIHTDDIGAAIEAAIDAGRPKQIRVTDLLEQVGELEEERWVLEAWPAAAPSTSRPTPPSPSPPRWWPWRSATASGASSTASACSGSSRAARR